MNCVSLSAYVCVLTPLCSPQVSCILAGMDAITTPCCVVQGKADATWVFMGWEGVDAKRRGVGLNAFSLEDSNIAYGYSPVLVAATETLQ